MTTDEFFLTHELFEYLLKWRIALVITIKNGQHFTNFHSGIRGSFELLFAPVFWPRTETSVTVRLSSFYIRIKYSLKRFICLNLTIEMITPNTLITAEENIPKPEEGIDFNPSRVRTHPILAKVLVGKTEFPGMRCDTTKVTAPVITHTNPKY
ncbi:hypothetical protein PPL_05976 [Heterostelium album PN500]|uniref:Uncharacterized protein n=1 Tax=Heterostelium pallidum (strain ATCC 26659 / Pp 5 / PN500) TaxID=670386 RepID=D3BBV6_HETP5|nr:hypothetical protein PPL_05976 [Heterostelium album PN500]EFA81139.1 hypothetical protein PPL_05976 [Heterostelium album PN500]|eukprot:XP_020433257.1 hypothetical protein PPL_05976 [Heterostelium album PN500]